MPLFGSRHRDQRRSPNFFSSSRNNHHRRFYRKDRGRVAAGYKAALSNPNTTRQGRKHAKHELHLMGRSAHVPLMTKIKRTLGLHSTSRRERRREREDEEAPTRRRDREEYENTSTRRRRY